MGFRAHVHRKHFIEYDDGQFNHQIDELEEFLRGADAHIHIVEDNDGVEDWELRVEDLKRIVNNLEDTTEDLATEASPIEGWTTQELVDTLTRWINISSNPENNCNPDYVYISWF